MWKPLYLHLSPKLDMIRLPVSLEGAVIPIVWAGEVTGQSKRAEFVRMKLKPGAGLVKQKQSPLKRESHKRLYPLVEKFIKYDLLKNCESKFNTPI